MALQHLERHMEKISTIQAISSYHNINKLFLCVSWIKLSLFETRSIWGLKPAILILMLIMLVRLQNPQQSYPFDDLTYTQTQVVRL